MHKCISNQIWGIPRKNLKGVVTLVSPAPVSILGVPWTPIPHILKNWIPNVQFLGTCGVEDFINNEIKGGARLPWAPLDTPLHLVPSDWATSWTRITFYCTWEPFPFGYNSLVLSTSYFLTNVNTTGTLNTRQDVVV